MVIPKINSAHGSDTRNIINRAIDLINAQGKSIQNLVAEGQLTPTQYAQLISIVNGLIKSGHVDKSDLTSEFKREIEEFNARLVEKADKIETENLKNQVNSLALGAGNPDASSAEILQARAGFETLNDRIEKNESLINMSFGLIDLDIKPGIYNSDGSEAHEGNYENWYKSKKVYIGQGEIYLTNRSSINLRANYYDVNGIFISRDIITNGKIVTPTSAVFMGLNFQLANPTPRVNGLTIFNDLTEVLEVGLLRGSDELYHLMSYSEEILNSVSQDYQKSHLTGKLWVVDGDSNSEINGTANKKYYDIIRDKTGVEVDVFARSGSGYLPYTPDGNTRPPVHTRIDSYPADADIITILAGGNNVADLYSGEYPLGTFGDSDPNASYYGALDYTFKKLIEKYPTTRIGALSQFKRGNHATREPIMKDMLQALKEVCGYYGVPVLDLYNGGNIHAHNADFVAQVMPDNVHINNVGHELLANKIQSFIESL